MDPNELFSTAVRATAVYGFMLVVVRLIAIDDLQEVKRTALEPSGQLSCSRIMPSRYYLYRKLLSNQLNGGLYSRRSAEDRVGRQLKGLKYLKTIKR